MTTGWSKLQLQSYKQILKSYELYCISTLWMHFKLFLLLVRYVPNVAKRSIWDQCKKKYILRTDRWPATSDQRPTSHLANIGEISNGHISARGRPLHFMFGSTVGFRGRRIKWRYFRFRQIQDGGIQMAISHRWIVRFTPCLVLGRGFRGRRIEWRYFRFCQIQDGGSAAILKPPSWKIEWRYLSGGSSDLLRLWF